jgi:cardiolipin synthase A/B
MGRRRRSKRTPGGWSRLLTVVSLVILAAVIGYARADETFLPRPNAVPTADADDADASGARGLFVEPDDGRAPVLDELDAARRSIDLSIYLVTDPETFAALARAERRGVAVRVILEEHPFGGFGDPEDVRRQLEEIGAEVRWARSDIRFFHIKSFVIDDDVALIMNLNLTRSAFQSNREFGIVTSFPRDVAHADAIFEADWTNAETVPAGPLVVSPTSSRSTLTALIADADRSIDIYAEVVRDRAIVAQLVAAESRGVEVRMLVPKDEEEEAQGLLFDLVDDGVEVGVLSSPYIHAKAIVVDGERAFVGSQNLTATSLDDNRELGLIVAEPANVERLAGVFATDFARATLL